MRLFFFFSHKEGKKIPIWTAVQKEKKSKISLPTSAKIDVYWTDKSTEHESLQLIRAN